ncbi:probable RNA-binding protein 18 [Argiope bruennichi]|uniref:Probable RNA-binding protein 18 n=1 Tax=Argiope bruennichi TaxID=94029 RepID=A0A8T0F4V3_ARGBR|nr:probable RNA-binding protein 18 [Argiope bruennichi]KAF8785861.1 putative RNA-binding protein 18 like protein [Argiope bruennichi]
MSIEPSIPLPLDPPPPPEADEKRLWIGNIDSRLTEYHLLKIVQKYGKIKKFDFLFHKSGALKGQPRGYSFVTYETREQAENALAALNGKQALGKNLVVRWAHTAPSESFTGMKKPTVLSKTPEETKQTKNPTSQIMAIEAKLKAMKDQREKELEMCLSATRVCTVEPVLINKSDIQVPRKVRNAPYNLHEKKQQKCYRR